MQIKTQRLILREYQKEDWQAVHEYAQQADILIYEAWGPNTENATQEFIKKVIASQSENPRKTFELAIILKDTNQLIGGCRLGIIQNKEASIGYIVNPIYWAQGFATEATMALINFAQHKLHISKIEAICDVLNIASQKVLEKCGLNQVRTIKDHLQMKGRFRDTYVYEKLLM